MAEQPEITNEQIGEMVDFHNRLQMYLDMGETFSAAFARTREDARLWSAPQQLRGRRVEQVGNVDQSPDINQDALNGIRKFLEE